jgi:xanthine dehydrogenase molybdopterin-binding subunit B
MTCWTANQWPQHGHLSVATVLGVQAAKVKIQMKRAGGGFGGKLTHFVPTVRAGVLALCTCARSCGCPLRRL